VRLDAVPSVADDLVAEDLDLVGRGEARARDERKRER